MFHWMMQAPWPNPWARWAPRRPPNTATSLRNESRWDFFASLVAAVGDLERIDGWLKLFGMVNVAPRFNALPGVINGASELILQVFGPARGAHSRSAVGRAELPFGAPVEIEAELKLKP
jgi:hypothetical protein